MSINAQQVILNAYISNNSNFIFNLFANVSCPATIDKICFCTKNLFRQERRKYYHHCAKARQRPEKCLSIIVDGMDQSKTSLPHLITRTKV